MLYCSYICFSALQSDPSSCNKLHSNDSIAQIIVGVIIAGLSTCYAGWSLANSKSLFGDDAVEENEVDNSVGLLRVIVSFFILFFV